MPTPRGAAPSLAPGLTERNRFWIFVAALASVSMTAIEGTIVATAMPTIVGALGDFDLMSWVFAAYLLTQAVTIPIYGRLADLYGRKPLLLAGISVFLAGSVLCGLARSMAALVLFRIVQGIGAGAVMPVGRTLIGDVYHGADRARMQGYVSGAFIGSAIFGPLAGAFLVAHWTWPLVFWINLPFGLAAMAMLAFLYRERIETRERRVDYLGSLLICLASGLLLFALAEAPRLAAALTLALAGAAAASLVLFILHERRAANPIWPTSLWRDRIVASGNIVNLALGATTMPTAAFLPAYIQGVMGDSAFVAGMALMAMSVLAGLGAVLAGGIMLRTSFRTSATVGAVLLTAGCVMMALLDPARGAGWAIASASLMGFGMGMNNNTYMVSIQAAADWSQRGIATSSIIFTRILGQAAGAAGFGGILNAELAGRGGADLVNRMLVPSLRQALAPQDIAPVMAAFDHALHTVFAICVALALLVMAVGFLLPAGRGLRERR